MSIKLYYQHIESNFGDVLSKEIVSFLSGQEVEWSPLKAADMVAVGSLAERVALKKMKRFLLCYGRPLQVWGTGFLEPGKQVNKRFINIHALRGMYSRERFKADNVPLGDPGLLTPVVFSETFEQHGSVVCIPHLHDKYAPQWVTKVSELFSDKQVISVVLSDPIEHIVAAIAGAEFVVTTAMHPLIVAQSYNVPFVWLESDRSLHPGARYKFEDYFSVFDKIPVSIGLQKLLSRSTRISDFKLALDSSIVPVSRVKMIQQDLMAAFPRLKK